MYLISHLCFFFFQAEDGIRDVAVTGVQTCALPILGHWITGISGHASRARRRCKHELFRCGICERRLLPISFSGRKRIHRPSTCPGFNTGSHPRALGRSEEHTSELQSRLHLVCRLLLEKKNTSNESSSDISTTAST